MIVTHKINMDLSKGGGTPQIKAVQNDKYSRNIEVSLFSDGEPWHIPEEATGIVHYFKPDGSGGSYDTLPDGTTACTLAENAVTVALAPQVCTAEGVVRLTVSLVKGASELHTFPLLVHVLPNPEINTPSETYVSLSGALPYGGWKPNAYLGTDGGGNVVTKNAVEGSGGSGISVGPEAPGDTNLLWVDTGDETEKENPCYTKAEIDAMLGSYIDDIGALVGGDA